ncbi:MAG: hypothetical protein RL336_1451 [Pseudomonadota bacterium]|jgi:sigma-54 specific flagellar transcriptional regulator A
MSPKRTVVVIDDGQDFANQLTLVLEFMGLLVHSLFLQDCEDSALPNFLNDAHLCFVPFSETSPHTTLKLMSSILDHQLCMPMVVTGHGFGIDDLSFVIGNVSKVPTFEQLQKFLYAADAHWARLSKTTALQAYVKEEIATAIEDAGIVSEGASLATSEGVETPRAAKKIRELSAPAQRHLQDNLVGDSKQMRYVKDMIARVHDKNASVLITGESGTGKEVVAKMLHDLSPRRNKAFVPVNCGAIPAELLESELFGHEKGAFTGAIAARAGRFELAEGGTLFLDEIGDMPLNMQVKILRVLQERVFERVGATKSRSCDVRVIAATHRNLEDMIAQQSFRADLFYRLNVFPIEVPALRERVEDLVQLVPILAHRLTEQYNANLHLSDEAIESLARHAWPGNIRELFNLLERLIIMFPNERVELNDLPVRYRYSIHGESLLPTPPPITEGDTVEEVPKSSFGAQVTSEERAALFGEAGGATDHPPLTLGGEGIDLKSYVADVEREFIQQALTESDGVVARAAELLNMRRTTLVEKMRKYDMSRESS